MARIAHWLGAPLLLAGLLGASGCSAFLPGVIVPQRIDSLASADCKGEVIAGIEVLLRACKEQPDVAHTLAQSAYDKMAGDVPAQPREGSQLAADLRIKSSRAVVASSSGNEYLIYADRNHGGVCELRATNTGILIDPTAPIGRCKCEDAQD